MTAAARYRGTRVAVTGASGYIASALLDRLAALGAQVRAVSRRPIASRDGVEPVLADVRIANSWPSIVEHADVIFHLAGTTSLHAAARDPEASLRGTVLPITHLADAARASRRTPRVILASTATVYGCTEGAVAESRPARPQTIYDLHKFFAEQSLEMASNEGVLDGVVLRLSNVYGTSSSTSSAADRGFLNRAVDQARSGADLCVYGDGAYVRDFVHVTDVIEAMLAAGAYDSPAWRTFNVGSGVGTTMREALGMAVAAAARVTGRAVAIRNVPWPPHTDPIEKRSFVAGINRITGALGWQPAVSLTDGIESMLQSPPPGAAAAWPSPLRLNLGCGGRPLEGYLNVDADSLDDIRRRYPDREFVPGTAVAQLDLFDLPFADGSVDEVRADSLIEHLAFADERRFFEEVVRILKPGGLLRLSTVDFERAARQWLDAPDDWQDFFRDDDEAIRQQHWFGTYAYTANNRWGYLTAALYGNQHGGGQFHRNCYSEAKLRAIAARLGLVVESVERFQWHGDRDHMLAITARKDG